MPASRSASASSPPRPKTNGSPPFEAHYALALARLLDQQPVDRLLVVRLSGDLPDENQLGFRSRLVEERRRDQPVVHDYIRILQPLEPRTVIRPGSPGPAPTR